MMTDRPKRVAIYTRVSRDEQNYGFSPTEQLRLAIEHATSHDYEPDSALHFHDDYTGKSLERPALTRLLDAVRRGLVDIVVCLDVSRWTRDQDHIGVLNWVLPQHGACIEFVRHQVGDDPAGRLMLGFHAFQGDQEWVNTRWRTQNGLRAKAKAGKPIGAARPPFGLRYHPPLYDAPGLLIKLKGLSTSPTNRIRPQSILSAGCSTNMTAG